MDFKINIPDKYHKDLQTQEFYDYIEKLKDHILLEGTSISMSRGGENILIVIIDKIPVADKIEFSKYIENYVLSYFL